MTKMPDQIDLSQPKDPDEGTSQSRTERKDEIDPVTFETEVLVDSLPYACAGVARRPNSDPTLLTPLGVEKRVRAAVAAVPAKGRQRPEADTVLDLDTRATVLDLPGTSHHVDAKDGISPTSPTVQMKGVPTDPLAPGIYTPFLLGGTPIAPPRRVPISLILLESCLPSPLVRLIKKVLRWARLSDW